jgi:hypothetical protein
MVEKINLNKDVFNRTEFFNAVDINFSELIPPAELPPPPPFTVENFFEQYEILFFDIPKEGDINSHQYLAQRSGDYVNLEQNNIDIQALLEEIAQLRQENLELLLTNGTLEAELVQAKSQNA